MQQEADYPWMVGAYAPVRRRFDTDDLATELDANGIAGSVAVQARASLDETRSLLAAAHGSPRILGVVGWFDLTSPRLTDEIGAVIRREPGGDLLVGVRHQAHRRGRPCLAAAPRRAARDRGRRRGRAGPSTCWCARASFPRQPSWHGSILAATLVLDHLGKPPLTTGDLAEWRPLVDALAACENVSCKLSGLVTEAEPGRWSEQQLLPPLRHALARFGPERSMFGSDWPVCLIAATYARGGRARPHGDRRTRRAGARAAVLAGTATRVYGLASRLIAHT